MPGKSFYAVLGVGESATADQIISAYRALVKTRHPDKAPPDRRALAENDFRDITEAYNTLRSPEQRKEYDRALKAGAASGMQTRLNPELESKQAFARGRKKLQENDVYGAFQEFEKAVAFKPDWAEAQFELGTICLRNAQWRRRGVEAIEKAMELDPEQPRYPVALIKIYLEAGLKTRAQTLLQTAAARFPGDAGLEALAPNFQTESGGGLLGFLKKKA